MYKNNYKKAFTLIETIIVVVIMSILGTIAFTASQNYIKSALNTSRKSNISNISKSLEIFSIKSGFYPEPSNGVQITFNGVEVWTQGTIGKSVVYSLDSMTEVIADPSTEIPYTYSRLNTKNEYQIAAVFEEELARSLLLDKSYANSGLTANAYLKGNYNGVAAKVSTGGIFYVLAIPSIISSDLSVTDVIKYKDNNNFVYNGYKVLPDNYKDSPYEIILDSKKEYNPKEIVVYSSGSFDDLKNRNTQILLLNNLKKAYSGSTIVNSEGLNKKILDTELDLSNPSESAQDLACDIGKYILKSGDCSDYLTGAVNTGGKIITWNGDGDGINWNDSDNWDLDKVPDNFDDVIIDMNVNVIADTSSDIEIGSLYLGETKVSTLTLSGLGSFTANSEIHIYNKDIITHNNNSSSKEHILNLISSNITIDSGGSVNVSGKGYANEQGLGAGSSSSGKGGGGAYGGSGGDNSYNSNVWGNKYGTEELPDDFGSGGGNTKGGYGGGLIKILVSGNLTVNGTIESGGDNGKTGGGGGAGGSILINANSLIGSGVISADGGKGSSKCGGGGGGRIAIYYSTSSFDENSISIIPGNGRGKGSPGEDGSIYIKNI